jgi:nicotinate-nucleotide pyrophosphorylase (carboxylating)
MDLEGLNESVALRDRAGGPDPTLEASGGITLENARVIAGTGVDFISVGALTHSAPNLDFSLLVEVDRG